MCENDHFVLTDHLGTVRKVVDRNGKTVSSLKYNAFGKLLNCTGSKPRFRYTGKMFDDDTGLQWNVNRWYDPSVGRWASEDPIGFLAKDWNLFRYCDNSPVWNADYFGLLTNNYKQYGLVRNNEQEVKIKGYNDETISINKLAPGGYDIPFDWLIGQTNNIWDKNFTVSTTCWLWKYHPRFTIYGFVLAQVRPINGEKVYGNTTEPFKTSLT